MGVLRGGETAFAAGEHRESAVARAGVEDTNKPLGFSRLHDDATY